MRKFFLFALLVAATTLFAETKVETFTPKDGTATTKVYVTSAESKECDQATWTVFYGGIAQNLGDMGSTNWASVTRAKYANETYDGYPYMLSSTIEGGIDSLWFTWNANGDESGFNWNIKIYINDQLVGSVTEAGGPKVASPFNTFKVGNLGITGDFTIKVVNESAITTSKNKMRFVIDNLSWEPKAEAGEKTKPTFEFAEDAVLKMVDAEAFAVALTNSSDATPAFESSDANVVTVDQNGLVTIVGVGTATITASVAETETFKPAEASYAVRVVPLNFHLETFTGAHNVTLGGKGTYSSTVVTSENPSESTGLYWTSYLGSVRDNLGGMGAANIAAAIRAKKTAETEYGYLLSSTISGGIDSLAFDWSCNGTEESRQHPWNIKIYINDVEVGAITDACTAIPATPYRFSVGDLKIDGDFTIKIMNLNEADNGTDNHYRWVMDNLEWYSYCEPKYGILVDGETFIAGEYNEAQTQWLEYTIVANLNANQSFTFYEPCSQAWFLANQEEGGYWFTYDDVNNKFIAPATGKYTIYLKMYGPDNNYIWTAYEDVPTGIENQAVKADVRKMIEDGMVVIYRNGVRYNLQGKKF